MADVDFHEQSDLNDVSLEGDITAPGLKTEDDEFSTLDEPVKDTVMRDLRAVGVKFWHVLYPKTSTALLREWDLWGPLILCVFMAMMLQGSSDDLDKMSDGGPQFAEVFVIYWVGAVVVTLNTKLLGGNISFFQSVCVLGYCVCPLAIALIICRGILIADEQTTMLFIIRFVTVVVGFGWSTFASTAFLAESQPPNRKALAMFPIFLFYFVISWLIISHTHS
ncbi:protein YIPF6-like [Mercenaria mercenaria]|uniref:protein YIPF6-like n=1 Tax=Mercenaria mercenaria TaxID=6596 RepID=UPI001E1D6F7B|nr:protein YIPF6-like [Mercenaria mercenaria]